jgi:hypothetical protein
MNIYINTIYSDVHNRIRQRLRERVVPEKFLVREVAMLLNKHLCLLFPTVSFGLKKCDFSEALVPSDEPSRIGFILFYFTFYGKEG